MTPPKTAVELAEQHADKYGTRNEDDWCPRHNSFLDGYRARDAEVARLRAALERADQFINNGIELDYIRMPDTPDPALETPRIIRAALAAVPAAPPFPDCRFKECDLPGQCIAEGKCHHPAPPQMTDEEIRRATIEECATVAERLNSAYHGFTGTVYRGNVENAIRALLAAPGMWQPIETAPKNRTNVIVCEIQWVGEAWYDNTNESWWKAGEHVTDNHASALYPTHWMPLPAPPSQTSIQPPPAAVGSRAETKQESHEIEEWPVPPPPPTGKAFARAVLNVELQDDLSQRLRGRSPRAVSVMTTMHEAADRIDALQAVVDELVALEPYTRHILQMVRLQERARRLAKAPQNG